MADRTWNPIDSKLYDEDWSKGARIVAGVLLARCPNQYGIFDIPLGYLKDFFNGIYTCEEIEGFIAEWEQADFIRRYNGGKLIWIVKKWKREQKNPSENNYKGAARFLEGLPKDLIDDFKGLYDIPNPLLTPLQPPSKGIPSTDSDPDPDPEEKTKEMAPAKAVAGSAKKKGVPIEEKNMKTDPGRLVQQWHRRFIKFKGIKWKGDIKRMGGQARELCKTYNLKQLIIGMEYLFDGDKPRKKRQYYPLEWDYYVRKISTLIVEGKEEGFKP